MDHSGGFKLDHMIFYYWLCCVLFMGPFMKGVTVNFTVIFFTAWELHEFHNSEIFYNEDFNV